MKKTHIGVTLQMEGFHCWPGAPEQTSFLRDRHRHIFHIECRKEVTHNDRDIEIIQFKRDIHQWLVNRYVQQFQGALELGSMSCEMLAEELLEYFGLSWCKVSEDDENYAIVENFYMPY